MSQEIKTLIRQINRSWQTGRLEDIANLLNPGIVMALPGFGSRIKGAETMIMGFSDFYTNAKVLKYEESDIDVDIIDKTAAATYTFKMVYEREDRRYESSGRDLWIFAMNDSTWKAVWRTMLDMQEKEV